MNQSIKLYNLLLDKSFSKEQAETFISELDESIGQKVEGFKSVIVTKEDLYNAIDKIVSTTAKQTAELHGALDRNNEIQLKYTIDLKNDLRSSVEKINETINKNAMASKEALHDATNRTTEKLAEQSVASKQDIITVMNRTNVQFRWVMGLILGQIALIILRVLEVV